MRRPAPLPPPAAPARAATNPRGESDATQFAPVIPLAGSERPPRRAEANDGEADATAHGLDPAGDARGLGLRDVWQAARARRRALRAEVRRFTVRQRRRRMVWLGVAAAFVLLVAGTVGAAYSPLFSVRALDIVGTSQLDATAVEEALSGQLGSPLALVDSSAVKAALVQFPLVESYTLEARPPSELVVRIVERTPIGVRESASGFTVLDAAGVALSTTPTPPEGLPALDVSGGTDSAAFRSAGQVMRSLPADIRAQVTTVAASTADDVTLTLGGTNTTIMWGSADDSALKALVLETQMRATPPDQVSSYDVSSPETVVVG